MSETSSFIGILEILSFKQASVLGNFIGVTSNNESQNINSVTTQIGKNKNLIKKFLKNISKE